MQEDYVKMLEQCQCLAQGNTGEMVHLYEYFPFLTLCFGFLIGFLIGLYFGYRLFKSRFKTKLRGRNSSQA